ncbi:probable thiopurine S-methyltransferase [Mya arenaria]|uniref:probable thiopurine S-methyltransferase n=1 Tax=Mya arenaria TaxID=6604 RepID=UPI0022E38DBF|nr:probable thiopurine S-methyltransferase [Mya arenaria]
MQNETTNGCKTVERKLNQFGDFEDVTNMSVNDWDYRWSLGQTKFHMPKVHPMLQKHMDRLTQGNNKASVFVPLCGKTLDMKWLLDEGYEVIGNGFADSACRRFFEEHNIPYTSTPLTGTEGVLYEAKDGTPIKLYRCDCFHLSSNLCGRFDCIWDRAGFVALPVKDRIRYARVMVELLKKDGRYLLDCFLVDNSVFGGPPFNCDQNDVEIAFGKLCKVEKLDTNDAFTKWQEAWGKESFIEWGIDSFIEDVYLLEKK